MFLRKGEPNQFGQTPWVLSWQNPDNAGNMGTALIEIGIVSDFDGLHIGGGKTIITWTELEAAKELSRRSKN